MTRRYDDNEPPECWRCGETVPYIDSLCEDCYLWVEAQDRMEEEEAARLRGGEPRYWWCGDLMEDEWPDPAASPEKK